MWEKTFCIFNTKNPSAGGSPKVIRNVEILLEQLKNAQDDTKVFRYLEALVLLLSNQKVALLSGNRFFKLILLYIYLLAFLISIP